MSAEARYFLFEQPWSASSWKTLAVKRLINLPGAHIAQTDQCAFKLSDRRRMGTDLAPLDLTWQAWHFQHLSLDLRGRRGSFGTSICQRKLGDEWGPIWRRWILRGRRDAFSTSASMCVAGVVLSVPP